MGKAKVILGAMGVALLGFCPVAISLRPAHTDYSGLWVLDKHRTRSLPPEITNFMMTVVQDDQQLVVGTEVEGETVPRQPGTPASRCRDQHCPSLIVGRGYIPGTLALSTIDPNVTYSLDGKETTAAWGGGEKYGGGAYIKSIVKARWSKNGRAMDLTVVEKVSTIARLDAAQTIKEHWTLSGDGNLLTVRRSVKDDVGTDRFTLVLRREKAPPHAPPQ